MAKTDCKCPRERCVPGLGWVVDHCAVASPDTRGPRNGFRHRYFGPSGRSFEVYSDAAIRSWHPPDEVVPEIARRDEIVAKLLQPSQGRYRARLVMPSRRRPTAAEACAKAISASAIAEAEIAAGPPDVAGVRWAALAARGIEIDYLPGIPPGVSSEWADAFALAVGAAAEALGRGATPPELLALVESS